MDDNDDNKLNRLLNSWNVDVGPSPALQQNVWQRINAGPKRWRPFSGFMSGFSLWLQRPAMTFASLAVFLVAGGSAGYWRGGKTHQERGMATQERYWRSVDPNVPEALQR